MTQTKSKTQSLTIQNALVAFVVATLTLINVTGLAQIDFDEGQITETVAAGLIMITAAGAVYGRLKATKILK